MTPRDGYTCEWGECLHAHPSLISNLTRASKRHSRSARGNSELSMIPFSAKERPAGAGPRLERQQADRVGKFKLSPEMPVDAAAGAAPHPPPHDMEDGEVRWYQRAGGPASGEERSPLSSEGL